MTLAQQLTLDWGDGAQPNAPQVAPALSLPVFAHPKANREIKLTTCVVHYLFTHARRRTIGMRISELGLEVRAPRYCLMAEVKRVLQERGPWIHEQLRRVHERKNRIEQERIVWAEGGQLPYLGSNLRICFSHGQRAEQPVTWDGDLPGRLQVALPPMAGESQIRDAIQAWLKRQAMTHFTKRLTHFAPVLDVQWQSLKLSGAKSRWGSADAKGQIRLNWRLIHAPVELIDYVVVHELSHLREMNHSPRFWDVVGDVMPDYPKRVRALHDWVAPAG